MNKTLKAFGLALALMTALAGMAMAQPTEVRIGVALEPPALDPTAGAAEAIDIVVYQNVFEGLTRIDHIAQTMAYDEMLSWSLFYTTLLQAEHSPMVDVVDPDGLVRSQAIRSGGLRVTLNGSQARRTLAGRFHEESFGSAVQHIALASDDIFATADALHALITA